MSTNIELLEKTLPVAPLKIVAMESCRELGQKVNDYIVSFRQNTINEVSESPLYVNYRSNNYLVDCECPPLWDRRGKKASCGRRSAAPIFLS